jgi:membrane complex biogenesis BtpA family protein
VRVKSVSPIIGVVHLLPLPGSPDYDGDLSRLLDRAERDARTYKRNGIDTVIVENHGDAPFLKEQLPPETLAAFTMCAMVVKAEGLMVGINALRNDARAALGIANAVFASFIRVNVHAGVVATDQGLVEGRAAETLRVKAAIESEVGILADVHVKHGRTLHETDIVRAARDLLGRGGADGVIVSGAATGAPTDLDELRRVREALPDGLILAGSGVRKETVGDALRHANAVIVGTSLKRGGKTNAPVDARRVQSFVKAARAARRRVRRSR